MKMAFLHGKTSDAKFTSIVGFYESFRRVKQNFIFIFFCLIMSCPFEYFSHPFFSIMSPSIRIMFICFIFNHAYPLESISLLFTHVHDFQLQYRLLDVHIYYAYRYDNRIPSKCVYISTA